MSDHQVARRASPAEPDGESGGWSEIGAGPENQQAFPLNSPRLDHRPLRHGEWAGSDNCIGSYFDNSEEYPMNQPEKTVYTAGVHTVGGREGGWSRASDGRRDVRLTLPGGAYKGTNAEQLFAVSWSACFPSAVESSAASNMVALPGEVAIPVEADPGLTHGIHGLTSRLHVTLPGLPVDVDRALADGANPLCPHVRATRNNIEAVTTVSGEAARTAEAGR